MVKKEPLCLRAPVVKKTNETPVPLCPCGENMRLIETIQILNGKPQRLAYHNERFNRSRNALFCQLEEVFLEEFLQIPEAFQQGKVKCRITYDEQVRKVEFEHYQERHIDSFFLVESDLSYDFKYLDRFNIQKLKVPFSASSEIIIIKHGLITDTSYSNLVFKDLHGKWWTPNHPLLKGIQREFLLDEAFIEEREISKQDLPQYSHFMMINALLEFDEKRALSIDKIIGYKQQL